MRIRRRPRWRWLHVFRRRLAAPLALFEEDYDVRFI